MCVTQKMGCFEYVIRLYPNDTQTHHRRPSPDAQKGGGIYNFRGNKLTAAAYVIV